MVVEAGRRRPCSQGQCPLRQRRGSLSRSPTHATQAEGGSRTRVRQACLQAVGRLPQRGAWAQRIGSALCGRPGRWERREFFLASARAFRFK